jgi:2-dehydropantoate 2-reductase
MRFAILGSGAVGGYYGAKLALAGNKVTFLARGAHLRAISERGLLVWSPLGDFTIRAAAEDNPEKVEPPDVVIFAVKAYDNDSALQMLPALVRKESAVVLTLQNGVDSVDQVGGTVGRARVLGGATYIATALSLPGLIEQTGTHRRIVFGELTGGAQLSPRVERIRDALAAADIQVEAVADARVPLWKKFMYLAPFAGFTGAGRLPIGPLWAQAGFRDLFLAAVAEVGAVARAEGVDVDGGVGDEIVRYIESIPPGTRSSLLIDLQMGKRIEIEALPGSVVRRGQAAGVPTPIMATLHAVLKPYERGTPR